MSFNFEDECVNSETNPDFKLILVIGRDYLFLNNSLDYELPI